MLEELLTLLEGLVTLVPTLRVEELLLLIVELFLEVLVVLAALDSLRVE